MKVTGKVFLCQFTEHTVELVKIQKYDTITGKARGVSLTIDDKCNYAYRGRRVLFTKDFCKYEKVDKIDWYKRIREYNRILLSHYDDRRSVSYSAW